MEENTAPQSAPAAPKELVVLLHGIMDNSRKMKSIERLMRESGYDTLNISYPSTTMGLSDLTSFLHGELSASEAFNNAARVHFVTHSMGGLLTRYYIHAHRPANLGRVVMAGTPNTGSEFADFLDDNPVLRPVFEWVGGPVGKELRVSHEHDKEMVVDYEVGVIAGSASINPLSPFFLPKGNDGTVAIERTKLDGMKDHIIVSANHPFMMDFKNVQEQALHFIRHGEFKHS